jgi:hypothetical protein
MPLKYCESVRNTVEICLRVSVRGAQIAEELKVSLAWVNLLNTNLRCFRIVSSAYPNVQRRPRQISFEAELGILKFIDQNATYYQDEIIEFLLTKYDINVHRITVLKAL